MRGGDGMNRRWAHLAKTLAAIMVVQLAYWLVLSPWLFQAVPPPDALTITRAEYAVIAAPTQAALQAASYRPHELPVDDCCEPGYRAARLWFEQPTAPMDSLGVVPIIGADNYRIHVNGVLLFGEGRMTLPDISYHGNVRDTFRIPQAMLKPGPNSIEFVMVRDGGSPYFFLAEPLIGDYDALNAAFSARQFTLNDYLNFSLAFGAVLFLAIALTWYRGNRAPQLFWLAMVAGGWTLRMAYFYMTDPPLHDVWRMFYLFLFVNLVPFAWLNLANHWAGRPRWWVLPVSTAALCLTLAIITAIFAFGLWNKVDTVDYISQGFVLATVSAAIALFLVDLFKAERQGIADMAVFALCLAMLGWDAAATLFQLPGDQHANRAMPFLLLAFVLSFIARNVRLFQSQQSLNALLAAQLAERTVALEAAHARETTVVRAKAHHSERQRIMRDMHDGLGSQLMSMLLMARRGEANPPVVAEGLQSVIDEMRLMIDSMDSVGESLSSAFTIFRDRMQTRVEGSGKQFGWHDNHKATLPDYGPRDVLQVFRIMQEAVANALKHSSGDHIDVTIAPSQAPAAALRITIADNGGGLGAANPRGRGMANMAARAESIGAALAVEDTGGGVRIILDLPEAAQVS